MSDSSDLEKKVKRWQQNLNKAASVCFKIGLVSLLIVLAIMAC